jgi:hypothetical protein
VGLWQVLETGGGAQNVANVSQLVDYAAGKLLLVRDTFPDYTLRNRQHAQNIISITDYLLRDDIDKVTRSRPPCSFSRHTFHDIGMVYKPDELAEEEDFKIYLDANCVPTNAWPTMLLSC